MSYDWKQGDDNKGGAGANNGMPLVPGFHYLRVTKVIRRKSDGTEMTNKNGASMMVIFEDEQGREGFSFFGCYEKMAWKLTRLASCAGVNLDEWNSSGYEPKHFENEEFANARLVGLQAWCRVYEKEFNGVMRLQIEEVRSEDLPADVDQAKSLNPATKVDTPAPPADEDIPF